VVESLTEQPGTSCNTCHAQKLNGIGFATENYDALGRIRKTQPVYDEKGTLLAQLPLDTTSVPRIWASDDTASEGPADLADLIAKSGKVEACFARQMVRYSGSRVLEEDDPQAKETGRDNCSLEAVRKTLSDGGSLREAMQALAMVPSFRTRAVEAE
jgi:hypothetical protein